MEKIKIRNNAEWLEFLSDLNYLACYLRCESVGMYANAQLVERAVGLLVEWNPSRRESIERCRKENDNA